MESVSSGDGYPQLRTTVGQRGLSRHGADDPRLGARPRPRPSRAVHPSPSMEGEAVDAELRLGPPDSGGASAVAAESKYVKVSVEGARYQRTVDLRAYGGHGELRAALLGLAGQMLDLAVAYEDNDGDILLAGDLPWDMFVSDCRSVRIMRRSTTVTSS
ncbi:auxin-responsive protein IAA12-like [Triticum dicoccoides]|uniref:auxin-responsive protein IAA12-like n=1 Tax=Triticum dicoccoides TaxID=85692 RepID=UPI000E7D1567|nr:auxin-responsive protein IAA12-like [Triticum dicoccoides]